MANYPASVSTNANLYVAVNGLQTTLAVACTNSDTTLTLTSTTGFPTTGLVTIDNTEIVSYTGVSGATITGCTRGADGTTAASHPIGVTVGLTVVAAHHNLLKDEIIAVETALGANLANIFPVNLATQVTGILPNTNTTATPNATANTIMSRDANGNTKINTIVENFSTTATAAGTTVLTASSSPIQQFTGTTTQNVNLPDATTLSIGYQISVLNRSTGSVTVRNNGGTALVTITANAQTTFTVTNISTANGVWDASTSSGGSAVVQYQRYIVGTPSGSYSGSTTVFDLPFAYTQDGKSMQVFYNGQMISASNYTESSSTQITMSTALVAGSEVVFRTIASGANATAVTFLRENYIVGTSSGSYTGSTTVFNLTNTYTPGGTNLKVYVDGDLQTLGAGIDYLETSPSIVTFNSALVSGQKVSFIFSQSAAPAGTVSNGTAGQLAYFPSTGTTVASTDDPSVASMNSSFLGMGRNRVINGGMEIDQLNGGSTSSVGAGSFAYGPDMLIGSSAGGTTGVFTIQRLSATPPANFVNYVRVNVTTADASIAAGDEYDLRSDIEGYNVRDFAYGTSVAKTATLSFWVRSALTGTYTGTIQNSAQDRSYPFEYTVLAANTWEQKSVTITGDAAGSWGNTTGVGIRIRFCFAAGTTYQGTANTWNAGNFIATANQVNFMSSNSGRTWDMTGLQLELGTKATAFEFRMYHYELNLCQRYYEKSYGRDSNPGSATGAGAHCGPGAVTNAGTSITRFAPVFFKATKRAIPTCTIWDTSGNINKLITTSTTDVNTSRTGDVATPTEYQFTPRSSAGTDLYCGAVQWVADARL